MVQKGYDHHNKTFKIRNKIIFFFFFKKKKSIYINIINNIFIIKNYINIINIIFLLLKII